MTITTSQCMFVLPITVAAYEYLPFQVPTSFK